MAGTGGLQRLLWYIQVLRETVWLQERKELTARQRKLEQAKQWVAESDGSIRKSYENINKGLLSKERFATLAVSEETELKRLKETIPEIEASLETTTGKDDDLRRFIERTRQVMRLTKLTPEIVYKFMVSGRKRRRVGGVRRWIFTTRSLACGVLCPRRKWRNCSRSTLRIKEKRRRSNCHAVQNQELISLQISRKLTLPYRVSTLIFQVFSNPRTSLARTLIFY